MLRAFASLSVAVLLAGCSGGSGPTGSYVGGDDTGLIRLTIVESDDNRINATMSVVQVDHEAGKISTQTGGLTGIREGKAINLLAANGSGGAMSLVENGGKLIWQVPDTGQSLELVKTDPAEYQNRLIQLSKQLNGNDVGLVHDDL